VEELIIFGKSWYKDTAAADPDEVFINLYGPIQNFYVKAWRVPESSVKQEPLNSVFSLPYYVDTTADRVAAFNFLALRLPGTVLKSGWIQIQFREEISSDGEILEPLGLPRLSAPVFVTDGPPNPDPALATSRYFTNNIIFPGVVIPPFVPGSRFFTTFIRVAPVDDLGFLLPEYPGPVQFEFTKFIFDRIYS